MSGRSGTDLDRAVRILDEDGVVGYPTDTLYGLGARIDREAALRRVFEIKGRPADVPLTVAVASVPLIRDVAQLTDSARRFLEHLPGPVTLILPRQETVSDLVTAGGGTVGVRVPRDETALALLRRTGPLTATSANRHGEPPARDANEAETALADRVDYYLTGRSAATGVASTIVDCTGATARILREGALRASEIRD